MKGAGTEPVFASRNARTCGRQAPPWHGPSPAHDARLSSSSSVKPFDHASSRSPTVTPMQRQTTAPGRWAAEEAGGRWPPGRRRGPARPGRPCARAGRAAPDQGRRSPSGQVSPSPPVGGAGHDRTDATALVALEADELSTDRDDRCRQLHAGSAQALGGARRQQAVEVVARTDRLDLGCTRGDDDLLGTDVEHAARCPGHDGRSGIDRDDLDPVRGVEQQRIRPFGGGSPAALAPTDDDDLDDAGARPRSPARPAPRARRSHPRRGVPGSRRPDAAPRPCPVGPAPGTSARTRCRPRPRGNSRSRRRDRACRRAPAPPRRE